MEIHWYPGHMAKTRRMIKENLPLIDTVVELVDARAPMSTHLPDIFQIIGSKRLVVVLNKADLADPNATRLWLNKFRELGLTAIDIDTPKRLGIKKLVDMLHETKTKGPSSHFRPMRCAILGVPNVGKSSLINQLARRKGAKTGDKPGVTKGKMWLKVDRTLELLDTPGILWPKFEEKSTAIKLALIGSIKDELVNIEELSQILIKYLVINYPEYLIARYNIELNGYKGNSPIQVLEQIAKNRGFLLSKSEFDVKRSSRTIMSEFRQGSWKNFFRRPDEQDFWADY